MDYMERREQHRESSCLISSAEGPEALIYRALNSKLDYAGLAR